MVSGLSLARMHDEHYVVHINHLQESAATATGVELANRLPHEHVQCQIFELVRATASARELGVKWLQNAAKTMERAYQPERSSHLR